MKKMESLIWVPLLLNSCFTVNHKNNYFVAGQFEAVEGEVDYCLEVEEISKNAYESSGKINMVEDVGINKYFSVQFYECIGGESILVDLINLRDENPRTKAIPASYIDDDEVTICSGITDNEYSNTNYYLIVYKSSYLYFDERIDKGPDLL